MLVAVLVGVVIGLILVQWYRERYIKYKGIPGPQEYPLIKSLIGVMINNDRIYEWFHELSEKYGHVLTIAIPGFSRLVQVTAPADVVHILQTNFDNYPKGLLVSGLLRPLFGFGIFATDGDEWHVQRKIASHMFKMGSIKAMASVFQHHGEDVLKYIGDHKGQAIDLQELFSSFTLGSFAEIAFGERFDALSTHKTFATAFNAAQRATDLRFLIPFSRILNPAVHEIVQRRRTDPKRAEKEDLLSLYSGMAGEDGKPFTDDQLRDFVLNFIIAGRDTTAQCLAWLCYNLSKNPRVEQKLLAEIKENFTPSTPIDFETVKNLKYLKACIDESLRLYPSVPLDIKMNIKDDTLPSGHHLPAGTAVMWTAWSMGRHSSLWDQPMLYFPERWLGDTSLGTKTVPQGQVPPFIPFQFGPRLCLGMNMAYLEIKVMTVMILQKFHLAHVASRPATPHRTITLSARDGMWMTVEPRS